MHEGGRRWVGSNKLVELKKKKELARKYQKHGDNKSKIENCILLYFLYLYNKGNGFKFKEEVLSLPETDILSLNVFPLEKLF